MSAVVVVWGVCVGRSETGPRPCVYVPNRQIVRAPPQPDITMVETASSVALTAAGTATTASCIELLV